MKLIEVIYVENAIIFTYIDDLTAYNTFVGELVASDVWRDVRKDKSNPFGIVTGGFVTDGPREGCRVGVMIPTNDAARIRILNYLGGRDDVSLPDRFVRAA